MKNWTAERFNIDVREADDLLARRWCLPQRQPRDTAGPQAASPPTTRDGASAVPSRRNTTMAYWYLHRAVSHFYQRVGNKAVSAFSAFVNDQADIGTLRRARGTQT